MNDDRNNPSTHEAGDVTGLSASTLDSFQVSQQGPVLHRFGERVRHRWSGLVTRADARYRVPTAADGDVLARVGVVSGTTTGDGHRVARALRIGAVASALIVACTDPAFASTDTTFAAPLATVTDMVSGTGGQLAAVLAIAAALVGSVLRFNAIQILGAIGVGVAAGAGTGIVTSLVGTAIV